MKITLRCRGYSTNRYMNELTEITPNLILVLHPNDCEQQAEALKRIELFLAGEINIVKAVDKPRCFYCASLNDEDANMCAQCGAPL